MTSLKTWRRFATAFAVLSIAIAAGLVGGAGTGHATTSFEPFVLKSLIGTDANGVSEVSYGGKMAFALHVENTGDSTTPQVQISIRSDNGTPTVTTDDGTFVDSSFDSTKVNCSGSGNHFDCTPVGGTLNAGDKFDLFVRFTAPGPGDSLPPLESVSTTANLTVAAKTVGGKPNQNATSLASSTAVAYLTTNEATTQTFLRKGEPASTTGKFTADDPQNFGVKLPALIGDPFGIEVSIHDELGALCGGCLNAHTTLSIPAAAQLVTALGNPFYRAAVFPETKDQINPYGWEMHAQTPPGFMATQVLYRPDGADTAYPLPSCGVIGPTATNPVCYDTITQNVGKKLADAFGHAIENGSLGFG